MSRCIWDPGKKKHRYNFMSEFRLYINSHCNLDLQTTSECHQFSLNDPGLFWEMVSDFTGVVWSIPPSRAEWGSYPTSFDQEKWDPQGARINFAENLIPLPSEKIVLVARSENGVEKFSANFLRAEVIRVQNGLKSLGVQKGDRVAGVVVNGIEAVVGMLAATSLGAVWSSCSPDFGSEAIVDRLGPLNAKIWFVTAVTYYAGKKHSQVENIQNSLALLNEKPVIISKDQVDGWVSYYDFGDREKEVIEFVPCSAQDPVYILFSSGTTGKPKGLIHSIAGTLLQHKKELMLHSNIGPDSILMYFTTCGWMMWNWMISALSVDACPVLWDGKPDPQEIWKFCAEEKIQVLGMSPAWVRQNIIASVEPQVWEEFELFLSTGSPLLQDQFLWLEQNIPGVQVASISGGTDIVSCFLLGDPTKPVYAGELQGPGLGMAVDVYKDGQRAGVGEVGELVCTQPFPSMPVGFWLDDQNTKYNQAYFEKIPGVWCHGDYVSRTHHDGYVITGRSDATLNPGGVRIGTAEIYQQVEKDLEVQDSLAISWDNKGQTVILLFVQTIGRMEPTEGEQKIKKLLRQSLSPRHVPWRVFFVKDIPYTRSGKKMELAIRDLFAERAGTHLGSMKNPECLGEYMDIEKYLRTSDHRENAS
ncbi:MAG: acetoacetate--CoA ligase [Oligoflexales bacterium]